MHKGFYRSLTEVYPVGAHEYIPVGVGRGFTMELTHRGYPCWIAKTL